MSGVRVPDERLDELALLAEAATPGTWFYDGRDIFAEQHAEGGHRLVIPLPETWHESQSVNKEDAEFIAAAGSDLAALVADLRAARADNQRLREALTHVGLASVITHAWRIAAAALAREPRA